MPHDPETEVISWLHRQQNWLQETALRILEKGSLGDSDIGELTAYLKTEEGRQISSTRSFPGIGGLASEHAIHLDCICEVKGIDNLDPRNPLEFGKGNLTVVYGNNGSGKSGYTRILKKAFGKPNAVALKHNIFQAAPIEKHCIIIYSIDGEAKSVKWQAEAPIIDDLKDIDIFDSNSGRLYLDEETEASYTPPLIALFEELVNASNRINKYLTEEEDRMISQLPRLPDRFRTTPAGKTYSGLSAAHSEASLSSILIWSAEDEQAKKSLLDRLATTNPGEQAKILRQQKQQVVQLVTPLEKATSILSKESCEEILFLKKDAVEKRKIAEDGAKAQTDLAKLDGIGSETWKAMWQAARNYSIEQAYPQKEFPNTEEEALCVLCHQTLSHDAKQRMKDFEAYVQGELEFAAKKAEDTYNTAIQAFIAAPSEESLVSTIQAAGLDVDEWKQPVLDNWRSITTKIVELSSAAGKDVVEGIQLPYPAMVETLQSYSKDLEVKALQYEIDARSFDREKAEEALLQLQAKEWTSQQAEAINTELQRIRNLGKIEEWKRLTNTTAISRKAGELSTTLITEAYIYRFNDELKKLGATEIKAALSKTGTRQGVVRHKVHLEGLDPRVSMAEILSEGEQRIVSLAAFLADVTAKAMPVPFIFDDPISSLDQDFEFLVAIRLGQLARDRQVIVFTHRLSLFGALEDVARKIGDDWKNQNLHQISIESFAGSTGHPTPKAIWMKNTKSANNILLERIREAELLAEKDIEQYKIYAQSLCSDFRKLIERTVEDDLLSQVVKRHRRSVTTDGRLKELPKINQADCAYIDELMTKYSSYEHSQSSETPVFLPDPEELRRDIEGLKTWRDEFRKRQAEPLI